mmetsp:Transcript_30623/g.63045  ORF Transcript_30623/g.63045 Transcript_30623/m.63045 type:complete len:210 (+) Transcript_30623:113-742(+)
MVSAVELLSLAIGTLLGLLFVFLAGLGKLLPSHPMHGVLSATFEKVVGPFFGLRTASAAGLLRLLIGAAEFSAGLVFLTVFLGELLGSGLPTKMKPEADALLLCAVMGMVNIMTGALVFHWLVDQEVKKIVPYVVFLLLLIGLLAERLEVTDFEALSENWLRFLYTFPCICLAGLMLSLACAAKYGTSLAEIQKQNEDIEKMREQLLSK